MERVFVFFTVVLLGVLGIIVFSNQNSKKNPLNSDLLLNPSPTSSFYFFSSPTPQQNPSPTVIETGENTATITATIKTSKGDITLKLYPKDAPKTVENFIQKAKSDYYKDLTFHRVEDWVLQGGDPKGTGTGGGNMPTELNSKPFVIGSLGVARGLDIKVSNDSQFFITKKEASWLNNQYTNFGIVTEGMDVVEKMGIGDKILSIELD